MFPTLSGLAWGTRYCCVSLCSRPEVWRSHYWALTDGGDTIAYVPVPKDLTNVKTKFLFNLTKRQLVCFGGGALVGVPLFFLTKPYIGTSTAALIMVFLMLPFFLLALYEKNGQPLEKVAKNMANVLFLRPKIRLYRTNNFYSALEKQNSLDTEVYNILHGKADKKR